MIMSLADRQAQANQNKQMPRPMPTWLDAGLCRRRTLQVQSCQGVVRGATRAQRARQAAAARLAALNHQQAARLQLPVAAAGRRAEPTTAAGCAETPA